MIEIKKGMRFINYLMEECIIVSIYRGVVRLRVLSTPISYIQPWSKEDFQNHILKNFFRPMNDEKVKRYNLSDYLYRYQLKMIGYDNVQKVNPNRISTTIREFEDFKGFALMIIRKVMKCNRTRAIEIFEFYNTLFGIKIKPDDKRRL